MGFELALDCRYYLGDRPCKFKCKCHCENYEPMGFRILIIKLGALGDVVRTACLLPTLKREYCPSHITWVSRPSGVRILRGHPMIDRFFVFDAEGILAVSQQEFDLVICLDKEPGPTALCNAVKCPDKRGISMSRCGTGQPCDEACQPYFQLGLNDDLKFHGNTKSYPELIHETLGLQYRREPYRLYCDEASLAQANEMFASWRRESSGAIVGLNTGGGRVFANKAPRFDHWVDICKFLLTKGYTPVLLGGPDEIKKNARIKEQVGNGVYLTGGDSTEQQFVAIVDRCDAIITGDTLALHVAISRDVPMVALFGPTCEQEIDLFGLGQKIVSTHKCVPCYRRTCNENPNCMDAISSKQIVEAVEEVLSQRTAGGNKG